MPDYLTNPEVWKLVWPVLLFPVVLTALVVGISFFIFSIPKKEALIRIAFSIFSLSLLGLVTGQLTGQSREAAVDSIIPAILGLISGAAAYLLSRSDNIKTVNLSLAVTALIFSLFIGTIWGANVRQEYETYLLSEEFLFKKFQNENSARLRADDHLEGARIELELLNKEIEKGAEIIKKRFSNSNIDSENGESGNEE